MIAEPSPGLLAELETLYRDLHANPELSMQEHRTAGIAAAWLRRFGYEVTEGIGGTGVVGVLRNGAGATVLLRADMDALPVTEATGLDYASRATGTDRFGTASGIAHACGHDMHMVWLMGVARLLAETRPSMERHSNGFVPAGGRNRPRRARHGRGRAGERLSPP